MKLRARFNELHDGKLLDRVKSETKGKFETVLLACLQATPEESEEDAKAPPPPSNIVLDVAASNALAPASNNELSDGEKFRISKRADALRRAVEAADEDALVAVLSDVCRADGAGRRAVAQASAEWRGPF